MKCYKSTGQHCFMADQTNKIARDIIKHETYLSQQYYVSKNKQHTQARIVSDYFKEHCDEILI